MRVLHAAAIAAVVILAGCTDPKAIELPADVAKWDTLKPALEKLTPEERELFATYAMRRMVKDAPLLGAMAGTTDARTVGAAIQNQRDFKAAAAKKEAEAKALAEKVKAERDAAMKAMRDVVTVALVEKKLDVKRGFSGIEMDRGLAVTFAYKNNGPRDIAGVKGTVIAKDLFGDKLSAFGISNDATIKSGATVTWTGFRSTRFTMGENKDEKFSELAADKYRIEWEPEMIVFADGTKLEAPK